MDVRPARPHAERYQRVELGHHLHGRVERAAHAVIHEQPAVAALPVWEDECAKKPAYRPFVARTADGRRMPRMEEGLRRGDDAYHPGVR